MTMYGTEKYKENIADATAFILIQTIILQII